MLIVDDFEESFSGLLVDVLAAVTPPTSPFVVGGLTPNWLLGCLPAVGALVVVGGITDDLLAEVTATG